MKKVILGFIFTFALIPSIVIAQVMDTSSITKLKSGQIQFTKGELAVSLSDTVSKDYALDQVMRHGYQILSYEISPSRIIINNNPPDSTLARLSAHTGVSEVTAQNGLFNLKELVYKIATQQGITDSLEIKNLYKRLEPMAEDSPLHIIFEYWVTQKDIPVIMKSFRNIAYQLPPESPRSMVVKTEVGKEEEAIQALEKLPFVTGIAYIGFIEED